MTTQRTHEIIAAYGGNWHRWPAGERVAAQAAVASDPTLRLALAEARRLDLLLDGWATRDFAAGDPAAAAAQVLRPSWFGWRVAAGGGLAAALAALFVVVNPATAPVAPAEHAIAAATITDEAAFASLFTPTPDEETVI